ncbi:pentatricopeptide repeat-containing protein [Senna tora]|uniref:Pentatricopeptide repeat-containing protein n=1 Tax=Senna tora TaxID=362788 RepID=A0A834TIY0_9FABA|nr:pentatricopeptide repeat-containing protein [Senna tora]
MSAASRCFQLILRYHCLCPFFSSASNFRSVHLPIFRITRCYFATDASPDKDRVANEVFNEFLSTIENATALDMEVYSAYINKACNAGNLSAARKMLQMLHEKNIFLSPKVYTHLLVKASQKNDIDLSCQVFKKLLLSNKSLSTTMFLNFAQSFTKMNDHVEVLKFVKEVSEMTCSSTSVVNRIIFAFAKSGQTDKALFIFDHFKRHKFSVDLVTYNTVLDILGRAGRVDEMINEFASLEEAGFVPDFISYNTLLNSLRKVGRLDMCSFYFKKMVESGIEPDLLTYTALIESFGRSGNVEVSLEFFKEMKLKKIRPSIYIYRSLIGNLNKAGKFELAAKLSEEMNSPSTHLADQPEDFKPKRRQWNTQKSKTEHN